MGIEVTLGSTWDLCELEGVMRKRTSAGPHCLSSNELLGPTNLRVVTWPIFGPLVRTPHIPLKKPLKPNGKGPWWVLKKCIGAPVLAYLYNPAGGW